MQFCVAKKFDANQNVSFNCLWVFFFFNNNNDLLSELTVIRWSTQEITRTVYILNVSTFILCMPIWYFAYFIKQ